jgi:hypothetical protein
MYKKEESKLFYNKKIEIKITGGRKQKKQKKQKKTKEKRNKRKKNK